MQNQILHHAERSGEDECCGLVINNQHYMECKNIAVDKQNNFEISPDDWIKAEEQGTITAIVHSHPNGSSVLSEADQYYREQTKLDWWLICHNHIYRYRYFSPLLGREFKHGITDCYTLFRDAYHLCGFDFPNFKRNDDWWKTDNLYLDHMLEQGFYQVDNVQLGDVILVNLGSKVPNHAAIYVGEQQILHHCPKRLSKRDLYDGYWFKYTHSIWRHKQWQPLNFTAILNNMAINSK